MHYGKQKRNKFAMFEKQLDVFDEEHEFLESISENSNEVLSEDQQVYVK